MPLRQTFTKSTRLDAAGAGFVEITMRGDFLLLMQTTRVVTAAGANPTEQATSDVNINGEDFEGSDGANRDSSDTKHLMLANDVIRCEWFRGVPLGTATFTIRGIQYDAGQGMAAIARQG
jgi:hypothetical protein